MSYQWSPEQDALLAEIYAMNVPFKQLPLVPGRTLTGMRARAAKLKLDRPRESKWAIESLGWKAVSIYLPKKHMTIPELAQASGLSTGCIREAINKNRSKVHIEDFRKDEDSRGYEARVWAWGPGEDAKPPKRLTRKERLTRHKRRLQNDPVKLAKQEARARLKYVERRGQLIRRDPLVAAFFG